MFVSFHLLFICEGKLFCICHLLEMLFTCHVPKSNEDATFTSSSPFGGGSFMANGKMTFHVSPKRDAKSLSCFPNLQASKR